MSFASIILLLVTLQRLGELVLSNYNTHRLLARGAIEVGASHYPLVVSVHAAWLIALWIWGRDQDVILPALAGFIVLQGLRLWILATLGPRWTTRIIVLRDEPLVAESAWASIRIRIASTAALSAVKISANKGRCKASGSSAISPATTA